MSKHKPYILGIAGGSGSGKTSLAMGLRSRLPNSVILHLDDFQKIGTQPEKLQGFDNWEHPSYVDWELFLRSLNKLQMGEKVTISHRDQTDLSRSQREVLLPQDFVIVEGYLLFFHPEVREKFDRLIFLQTSDEVRVNRRTKFKDAGYIKHVLLPMHNMYVEPTKQHAHLIIDSEKSSVEEEIELILNGIF